MAASTPEFSPDELAELLTAHMPEIPGYQVSRRLGSGGMSYVYLGVQESLNRQVAIKLISPVALKDEISKVRFEREARTIAKLQHPAIVDIYEVGRTELGLLYYVMPYLPRGNLAQRDLRDDEPRLIAVLRALLWALEYAHEHGVVHRDVKAENVLFDNVDRPRLTDFGIAVQRSDGKRLTNRGFALGSATHMAPEQARGEKVDARADLYSMGVLAYELLTGELPFEAEDALALAVRHSIDPVPLLPPEKAHWQPFIQRAMAKTPEARFATAREMMSALDGVELQRQPLPLPPSTGSQPAVGWHSLRTSPTFLSAAALVVLLLAVTVGWFAWSLRPSSPTPPDRTGEDSPMPGIARAPAAAPVPLPSPPFATPGIAAAPIAEAPPEVSEVVDPALPPEQRALLRAEQQIARRRLTQPGGDNALESLLDARRLGADATRVAALGDAWLRAMQPYLQQAFAESVEQPDRRQFDAAGQLADALGLRSTATWRSIEALPAAWLRRQLQAALAAGDLQALRAARALASQYGVAEAALEPEWSQTIVTARVGDRVPGTAGLQLLRIPTDTRPGLAAMPRLVSRADYARFVAATGRSAARCRIRTATFTMRARRWDKPGFAQQDGDPVVCVSLDDALAYARWAGQRDGVDYRLASAAHGSSLPAAAATACAAGQADCANRMREWSAPCGAGCTQQPLLGRGWRDAGQDDAAPARVDPSFGYDDVGFRLLRDVQRSEVEQR